MEDAETKEEVIKKINTKKNNTLYFFIFFKIIQGYKNLPMTLNEVEANIYL